MVLGLCQFSGIVNPSWNFWWLVTSLFLLSVYLLRFISWISYLLFALLANLYAPINNLFQFCVVYEFRKCFFDSRVLIINVNLVSNDSSIVEHYYPSSTASSYPYSLLCSKTGVSNAFYCLSIDSEFKKEEGTVKTSGICHIFSFGHYVICRHFRVQITFSTMIIEM